ncbi:FtsX-like permease family protein [Chitinophagaceae bacterium LWZ2-11]
MFRNYFKTAWRNLLKNKLNASINVIGLSIAFICCIMLLLTVHYEFSYDNFQVNKDRLFKVYEISHTPDGDEKSTSMAYPAAPTIKSEVAGVVKTTSVMSVGSGIGYKNKEVEKNVMLVDNDFFSMFSFPILSGNQSSPLSSTGNVVLSKTTADALFGKEDPIGKTIKVKVSGEWKDLAVASVIKDVPDNSSVRYDVLARIEINNSYAQNKVNWNAQNHPVYVQIAPNATQLQVENGLRQMVRKYNLLDDKDLKMRGYRKDANGDFSAYKLAPFSSLHFDNEISPSSAISKPYLYTLILIACVVMIIACFNFINLNVARAFTRAREVGVRKTIGADKKQIFLQLWTESFLLCAIALVIAVITTSLLLRPFNQLFTEKLKLTILLQPVVVTCVLAGMLLVSFLAGGYPAWLVARFKVVEVLKGKVSVNRSAYLRNGLITFQFIMSSLLICGTFVIYSQFQHLRSAPLGFEQESVISIPIKRSENSNQYINELRLKLLSQPQITSVTGSSINLGIGEDKSQSSHGLGFDYKGKTIFTNVVIVDYDYLKTIGITPIAGREFSPNYPSDTSSLANNVVVTESVAKQFGEKNVEGLSFYSDSSKPKWNIVGIIPDFHLYSMHEKIAPVTLFMNKKNSINYIFVKVKTNNPVQTMSLVTAAYKEIEPDNTVKASYLSENTQRWYDKEKRLSTIFCSSAGIAILLSCLGLFAIVSLVMEQRRKEIGVRKVLGASVTEITTLLSKDFLKLVVIAFLIATPTAWYFLNKWLQDFTYRINISWWIFPLAGVLTLMIALLTISFQTIKASLANPVKSLRSE